MLNAISVKASGRKKCTHHTPREAEFLKRSVRSTLVFSFLLVAEQAGKGQKYQRVDTRRSPESCFAPRIASQREFPHRSIVNCVHFPHRRKQLKVTTVIHFGF